MTGPVARLVPTDDAMLWDRLVRTSPGGTDFHDWWWLDFAADLLRVRFDRLLVVIDDAPIGVLPVPRAPDSRFAAPHLPFPFLGPLVPADLLPATLRALRRWQAAHGLLVARMGFAPAAVAAARSAVTTAGLRPMEDSTVLIGLTHGSVAQLDAGMSRMRRRSIARAVGSGCSVRLSEPGEITELLDDVLDDAFGARGVASPYPADVGARVEEAMTARPDVYCGTALVDDEPAGVLIMLASHPVALSWAGGCLHRFRDQNPNVLLYRHQLLWAMEHGNTAVDLVGRVDEGVLRFKLAFGGVERPVLAVESSLVPSAVRGLRARLRAR